MMLDHRFREGGWLLHLGTLGLPGTVWPGGRGGAAPLARAFLPFPQAPTDGSQETSWV